jgi:hypothetical protein
MPAVEAERLVAEASKSRSSTGSRYATPVPRRPKIPAPKSSACRSGGSRPGYNSEEVLMLTKEQHSMLRVSPFLSFPMLLTRLDALSTSAVDGTEIRLQVCDMTKLYDANSLGHKASVISCVSATFVSNLRRP